MITLDKNADWMQQTKCSPVDNNDDDGTTMLILLLLRDTT